MLSSKHAAERATAARSLLRQHGRECERSSQKKRHQEASRRSVIIASLRMMIVIACKKIAVACKKIAVACKKIAVACKKIAVACKKIAVACNFFAVACNFFRWQWNTDAAMIRPLYEAKVAGRLFLFLPSQSDTD
jgi:UDP:flavonoid glycosyltransferase YjiC (YdhE family)